MKRILLALLLLIAPPANAYWQSRDQTSIAAVASYTGPGDVVASASAFWGLRAYNAAYATGLNKLANICLPADAVCADATSDANGNLVLPGSLSTCANSVTICTVKTLYDQSGALACAAGTNCDVTQATIANRPTLVIPGAANGCPTTAGYCMAFVRASSQCFASANAFTQTQPFSFSFVGNRTGSTTSANIAVGFAVSAESIGWQVSANVGRMNFGTVFAPTGFNDNAWHAAQIIANGASSAFDFDGTSATGNAGTNAPSAVAILIGAGVSACASALDGKLTEVGIWPIAFSAGNISGLNSNAHTYWGF